MAKILHRFGFARRMAKSICRSWVLTQPFHGGAIAFNAVSHAWAWTGTRSYETLDRPLQDRLLALSIDRGQLLDIGANVGS